MREIGKRSPGEGTRAVPNPFLPAGKAPVVHDPSGSQLANPATWRSCSAHGVDPNAPARRNAARSRHAFLDAQRQWTSEEDRHAGLLHGRPARRQDRGNVPIVSAPARRFTAVAW